jgi:formylglycine-generating enzyme required for sulfatase activity
MGFFDFLKPKKDPLDDPKFRPFMIMGMAEQLATRCDNLKTVGRETEARAIAVKFLMDSFRSCGEKEFRDSAKMLSAFADAAITLDEAQMGKQLLDGLIEAHEEMQKKKAKPFSIIDLTQPYIEAGRLAHRIPNSSDEEYRCFWLATEAQSPAGCKEPASHRQKAIAHNFAYSISAVTVITESANSDEWKTRKKWHDAKRREHAPEVHWDNPMAVIEWLKGNQTATQQINQPSFSEWRMEPSTPKFGTVWETKTGMSFCGIEPGTFVMGSPKDEIGRGDDEDQVVVNLTTPFWISRTLCTQEQWRKVMGNNPRSKGHDMNPVVSISWHDAMAFCVMLTSKGVMEGWLGSNWVFKLPTEAQWEYCCRAGSTTALSNGGNLSAKTGHQEVLDDIGWCLHNQKEFCSVGQKSPNAWGIHDMHGLASEWCFDWYSRTLCGGTDPRGAETGERRVVRGGTYLSEAYDCRSAQRGANRPDNRNYCLVSFRLVLERVG